MFIRIVALLLGAGMVAGVVLDAFQTIILPRRPSRRVRITSIFYRLSWTPWAYVSDRIENPRRREQMLSFFGPLSLLLLLVLWALLLTTGFALLYVAAGTPFLDTLNTHHDLLSNLRTGLYVSGSTLFTLGPGDVIPHSHVVRGIIVFESGTGLGFVALVIGYLPVLYQAFSRREANVALLDARAGSPPTATELLRRHSHEGGDADLIVLLSEWERWAAELLESHISYPILCFYRSQHDNQSWLSALVCLLDACALLITTAEGEAGRQAQLTFAMGRHALIDLGHVFRMEARTREIEQNGEARLTAALFGQVCHELGEQHLRLCGDDNSVRRLTAIRALYEPQAQALAEFLRTSLPLWVAEPRKTDPWRTVAGLSRSAARGMTFHLSELSTAAHLEEEHED